MRLARVIDAKKSRCLRLYRSCLFEKVLNIVLLLGYRLGSFILLLLNLKLFIVRIRILPLVLPTTTCFFLLRLERAKFSGAFGSFDPGGSLVGVLPAVLLIVIKASLHLALILISLFLLILHAEEGVRSSHLLFKKLTTL